MSEYFLIVDTSASATIAAQILRSWRRIETSTSAVAACARIAELDESKDDLVAIVDAALLDATPQLAALLESRPNTVVLLAHDNPANAARAVDRHRVVNKPYSDALLDQTEEVISHIRMNRILVHVVSILMINIDSPRVWSAAGSGCLIRLPQRDVILTAGHVAARMRHDGTRTYIGGNGTPVEVSSWPTIGADDAIDIATIGVPEGFDPQVIQSRFYVPPSWPPTRAQRGNAIITVGFPSEHRLQVGGMEFSHGMQFADFVSSSSTRHFVSAPENLNRRSSSMTERLAAIDDIGGMSGCPMFVAGHHEKGQLRGVLKEGGRGPNAVLLGAHTDFVLADGTIDNALMR